MVSEYIDIEITDDSGLLALIDPYAYIAFVGEYAPTERLFGHFMSEMAHNRLLLWQSNREDIWRIRIAHQESAYKGFRELVGYLRASDNYLCLLSYDSLMGASLYAMFPFRWRRMISI